MFSPGSVIAAIASAVFIAVVTLPFFALYRWLGKKSDKRKQAALEAKGAKYAEDFKRKEAEFEESLRNRKG